MISGIISVVISGIIMSESTHTAYSVVVEELANGPAAAPANHKAVATGPTGRGQRSSHSPYSNPPSTTRPCMHAYTRSEAHAYVDACRQEHTAPSPGWPQRWGDGCSQLFPRRTDWIGVGPIAACGRHRRTIVCYYNQYVTITNMLFVTSIDVTDHWPRWHSSSLPSTSSRSPSSTCAQ